MAYKAIKIQWQESVLIHSIYFIKDAGWMLHKVNEKHMLNELLPGHSSRPHLIEAPI